MVAEAKLPSIATKPTARTVIEALRCAGVLVPLAVLNGAGIKATAEKKPWTMSHFNMKYSIDPQGIVDRHNPAGRIVPGTVLRPAANLPSVGWYSKRGKARGKSATSADIGPKRKTGASAADNVLDRAAASKRGKRTKDSKRNPLTDVGNGRTSGEKSARPLPSAASATSALKKRRTSSSSKRKENSTA